RAGGRNRRRSRTRVWRRAIRVEHGWRSRHGADLSGYRTDGGCAVLANARLFIRPVGTTGLPPSLELRSVEPRRHRSMARSEPDVPGGPRRVLSAATTDR